jgi:hypothetical protein
MSRCRHGHPPVVPAAVLAALLLLAGCRSGAGGSTPSATGGPSVSATVTQPPPASPTTPSAAPSSPPPSSSAPPAAATSAAAAGNPLFPLTPGFQSVRTGGVNKGNRRLEHRLVFTVTDVTKTIDGKTAVAGIDQDFDGGELAEQSLEFFVLDGGAVRYLGSYTETYEGGQFVNSTDAWLSGVRGGRSGILLPAAPRTGSDSFTEAFVPGEGAATGKVVKTGQKQCVPFRCFADVVVVEEDGDELKYYAPGVGGIKTEPLSGDPQETEELVNVTTLSPSGLAQLSDEVVRLDQHARSVSRDVYGSSSPAKRRG